MPLDLTDILAGVTDIERDLFKPENSTLELIGAGVTLATLTNGFDWEIVDQRARADGKRFTRLTIYDIGQVASLSQTIRRSDAFKINGRLYKATDKFEPEEATKEWIIELQPTGK